MSIYRNMEKELNSRVDEFSQELMIAHIELLLSYVNRYYKRQFITRKVVNDDILSKTEAILDNYLNSQQSLHDGFLPFNFSLKN